MLIVSAHYLIICFVNCIANELSLASGYNETVIMEDESISDVVNTETTELSSAVNDELSESPNNFTETAELSSVNSELSVNNFTESESLLNTEPLEPLLTDDFTELLNNNETDALQPPASVS